MNKHSIQKAFSLAAGVVCGAMVAIPILLSSPDAPLTFAIMAGIGAIFGGVGGAICTHKGKGMLFPPKTETAGAKDYLTNIGTFAGLGALTFCPPTFFGCLIGITAKLLYDEVFQAPAVFAKSNNTCFRPKTITASTKLVPVIK